MAKEKAESTCEVLQPATYSTIPGQSYIHMCTWAGEPIPKITLYIAHTKNLAYAKLRWRDNCWAQMAQPKRTETGLEMVCLPGPHPITLCTGESCIEEMGSTINLGFVADACQFSSLDTLSYLNLIVGKGHQLKHHPQKQHKSRLPGLDGVHQCWHHLWRTTAKARRCTVVGWKRNASHTQTVETLFMAIWQ